METNKILSIIAYYLSEYDIDAVKKLGYSTQKEAFENISASFGKDNNYLKLRRDEFDALPESSSKRKGWRNRKPAKGVVEMAHHLRQFSFDELSQMILSFVHNGVSDIDAEEIYALTDDANEQEIESIINAKDENSALKFVNNANETVRIYNRNIITNLKKLYKGKCQLCGGYPLTDNTTDICEAHHIEYYSKSANNNAENILIICPNHHTLIHKLNPVYDSKDKKYIFPDGKVMTIKFSYHSEN